MKQLPDSYREPRKRTEKDSTLQPTKRIEFIITCPKKEYTKTSMKKSENRERGRGREGRLQCTLPRSHAAWSGAAAVRAGAWRPRRGRPYARRRGSRRCRDHAACACPRHRSRSPSLSCSSCPPPHHWLRRPPQPKKKLNQHSWQHVWTHTPKRSGFSVCRYEKNKSQEPESVSQLWARVVKT